MYISNQFPVKRTLRYVTRPAIDETEYLVYLLHGYGQLAEYFIQKIEGILPQNVCFIAPEGMHRFYLKGTSGRVGASWMTKEARELDIAENSQMLFELHEHILTEIQPKKIIVLGFSQGGATASRWLANSVIQADALVLWASVFPSDVSIVSQESNSLTEKNIFVLGSDDEYFVGENATAMCSEYEKMGFEVERFTGRHDLNTNLLERIIQSV